MNNLCKSVLFLFIVLAINNGCESQTITALAPEYEACCGAEPVEIKLPDQGVYVFIPNAFTPNADGVNDKFAPVLNSDVVFINYMLLWPEETDPSNPPPVMYERTNISIDNLAAMAWNGKRADGLMHKGSFMYEISMSKSDGFSFVVRGRSCAIRCEDDATELQNNMGCFYPVQACVGGRLDSLLTNKEVNCF